MPRKARKLDPDTEKAALQHFGTDIIEPYIEENKAKRTQWKKGQSGNPKGRTANVADNLTDTLALTLGKEGSRRLAKSLIAMATDPVRPNLHAIMYIYDRLEGKPRQSVEQIKQEENPLLLVLKEVIADDNKLPAGTRIPQLPPSADFAIIAATADESISKEDRPTV